MLLLNNLFTITGCSHTDEGFEYQILLDEKSIIYSAHFPGKPITPGVCIIQIAQELYEQDTKRTLRLMKIKNVKFLSVMVPGDNKSFVYKFRKIVEENGIVRFQVSVSREETVFAKMSLECKIA